MLDISMPKLNGIEVVRLLKRQHPEIPVLMLTVHETEEYVYQVVRAGAENGIVELND